MKIKIVRNILFGLIIIFFSLLAAGVNFVMPSYQAGYIAGVEVKRMDKDGLISKANPVDGPVRDVYFISTHAADSDTEIRVYRNEDTHWGFPFYFKFGSADVAGLAQSLANNKQLVQIKYYGWRLKMFEEYPNIISIKPLDNVNDLARPWVSYFLYTVLLIGFGMVIQMIRGWFSYHINSQAVAKS